MQTHTSQTSCLHVMMASPRLINDCERLLYVFQIHTQDL